MADKLIQYGKAWETYMWHYRPFKPIVDGNFLPKYDHNSNEDSLTAFLPDHPKSMLENGNFNKVFQ